MRNLFAILLLVFPATAFAESSLDRTKNSGDGRYHRGACHDDMQKFCGGVKSGEGRIARCVQEYRVREYHEQLTPACKAEMNKANERADKKRMACTSDVERFCKGAEKGAIRQCLKQHESALSDVCRKANHRRKPEQAHPARAPTA